MIVISVDLVAGSVTVFALGRWSREAERPQFQAAKTGAPPGSLSRERSRPAPPARVSSSLAYPGGRSEITPRRRGASTDLHPKTETGSATAGSLTTPPARRHAAPPCTATSLSDPALSVTVTGAYPRRTAGDGQLLITGHGWRLLASAQS